MGIISRVPTSATGSTGMPKSRASRAAPEWKRLILPSVERVPSGKMRMLIDSATRLASVPRRLLVGPLAVAPYRVGAQQSPGHEATRATGEPVVLGSDRDYSHEGGEALIMAIVSAWEPWLATTT